MFEKRGKAHRNNAYICKNLGYLNWFIWNFSSFLYYTILQIVPLSSHSEIFTLHVLFFWTLGKKFLHRYSHPLVNAVSYSARIRITWFFDRVLKNLQCYFIVHPRLDLVNKSVRLLLFTKSSHSLNRIIQKMDFKRISKQVLYTSSAGAILNFFLKKSNFFLIVIFIKIKSN